MMKKSYIWIILNIFFLNYYCLITFVIKPTYVNFGKWIKRDRIESFINREAKKNLRINIEWIYFKKMRLRNK